MGNESTDEKRRSAASRIRFLVNSSGCGTTESLDGGRGMCVSAMVSVRPGTLNKHEYCFREKYVQSRRYS
jgi:hypothetical protein